MSHTYRLLEYVNGKPVFTRNERQTSRYHYARHEFTHIRRHIWKKHRLQCRHALRMGRDPPRFRKTCGWRTW